ncbi:MAG: hypothetical protein N2C13_06475 [Chloroflexota bacterium]
MEQKVLKSISNKVSRQFPEVAGKKPSVKRWAGAKSLSATETFLLVYKGKALNPAGKTIPRHVRVVANAKGKIIKITTSK